MKNIVCGSYHKMSVTAITARFATSVWTAATIRFITKTLRMMKKGNALTIGFVRAFLLSLKISCVKFASKGDFDSIEIRKSLVLQDFSGFCNHSHSMVKMWFLLYMVDNRRLCYPYLAVLSHLYRFLATFAVKMRSEPKSKY